MGERLRYWVIVLRTGFKPIYGVVGFLTVVFGGSLLVAIGIVNKWSTPALVAMGVAVALLIIGAALEGAYRLRPQRSRPDITIARGRTAASVPPMEWGNTALDIALHHVQIANRGDQPVHLEFTPRSLRPTGDEELPKPLDQDPPFPNGFFEQELHRRWGHTPMGFGALLSNRVRVEPQSFVEGYLAWGWLEDKAILEATTHIARNVASLEVTDLISGYTWREIGYQFDSREISPSPGPPGPSGES